MVRPFRFSVNMLTPADGKEWARRCRRAEELGYDVIQVPDHLGMMAPFPAMVAAAAATERPRIGAFVLNAGFWNPALLAREIATTDALIGGRLEVGLGTGYVREEHERAGLEFLPPGGRVDHLVRTVEELDRLLRDGDHLPRPAQSPRPPFLIGGNGDRVLRLAALRAEVVAFAGGYATKEGLRLHTAQELEQRVDVFRGFASGRGEEPELNLLVQQVVITEDRHAAVQEFLPHVPHLTEQQALDLPVLAIGTVQEIAEQFRAARRRYGFSYFSVLDTHLEALAPVMRELRDS
ncbi:TIGR03621 family F420-dependent LLM class oxidoreductase [Streptomyces sp. NPDC051561]|uniref:TIGR03621 family F420-dependent LLM class oxidoreductase n=1 Tax=Streptomyces sp. NPDC051561 TaxID=3365658 RepID=UPI003799C971